MAVLPASPCYQAVRLQLRPHYHGIWVPDSFLASDFQRYAAVHRAFARHGSSVPGPLEHRKRMARRHMGELHFGQSHAGAPIWDLANLVDLTKWQWMAPTLKDATKRHNVSATETRTLPHAVLDSSQTLMPPPANPALGSCDPGGSILPDGMTLNGVAESLVLPSWGIEHTPADIIDAGLTSIAQDIMNQKDGMPLFTSFCDNWRRALQDGLFHGEAIMKVLSGISDQLSMPHLVSYGPKTDTHIKVCLAQATLEGISRDETQNPQSFDHALWTSVLQYLSRIEMNTVRIFTAAMAHIPESCIEDVMPGIMSNLDAFLTALGQAKEPSIARQADKMATALEILGRPEFRFVLDDVTQRLSRYTGIKGIKHGNVRFGWLHMLGRLPNVDIAYLSQASLALEANPTFGPLSEADTCRVYLTWANRRSPLTKMAKLRRDSLYISGTKCYFQLGLRCWQTRQLHRLIPLARFLEATGGESNVKWLAKGVRNPFRTRGPGALALMAMGLQKPRMAIDIYCLFEESRRQKVPFWTSPFGFKALEYITSIPNLNPHKLWRVLKIRHHEEFKTSYRRRELRALDKDRISKTAAVAAVVGMSPHISMQKSFAFMVRCFAFLRRRYAKLPPFFIRALIHNVTRELAAGRPGVTRRLRYVLYVIQRELGDEQAKSTSIMFSRMRRANMERI